MTAVIDRALVAAALRAADLRIKNNVIIVGGRPFLFPPPRLRQVQLRCIVPVIVHENHIRFGFALRLVCFTALFLESLRDVVLFLIICPLEIIPRGFFLR